MVPKQSNSMLNLIQHNDYENNICIENPNVQCSTQKCFIYTNTDPDPVRCKYNVFTDETNEDCLFSTKFGSFYIDREEINNRIDSTLNLNSFSIGYEQGKQSVS